MHNRLWKVRGLFFPRASEKAGILNPGILLVNHVLVTDAALSDTVHEPNPPPSLKVNGNRQSFALFTLPPTISQRKFMSVHFKMARKLTVSKFH